MINNKKIAVCLPAYNAAKTLAKTFNEIPHEIVDFVILVDDASTDKTVELAQKIGIHYIIQHDQNKGYGGNQKTCYAKALEIGADIVVMLHPDYQYNPALIAPMATLIATEVYDVVLGSRILGKGAMQNGMPFYKYFFNRLLTFIQNILLRQKLSEYHTGLRAYKSEVLSNINIAANSNDFVFDNQLLAQVIYKGFSIGEMSAPARYFPDASSINFPRSVKYGFGVLITSIQYCLNKWRLIKSSLFR
jgi:glycosyltransferase involved in cell wall biosynthesis